MKATSLLATATAAATIALAVPNVKVVPLKTRNDCTAWPDWLPLLVGDTTGPFTFQADQTDDPGVNGLSAVPQPAVRWGTDNTTITELTLDLLRSTRFAKTQYRCFNGTVRTSGGDPAETVRIGKDVRNGFMYFGAGYELEPYAHEMNGQMLDGMFVGAKNQTTWGFNYVSSQACGENGFYEARLQGLPVDPNTEPMAAREPEFYGFMRIVPL